MNDDLAKLIGFIDAGGMSRRGFLTRTAAFGATAALATGLAGGAARAADPKKGGVLKMGLGGGETTDTLDPALVTNKVGGAVNRQWGDTLVTITPDGKVEPRLCESYEPNADATEWKFKIREGVKFHDGSAMTAEDVAATYKRHSDANTKSGAAGIMKGLKEIKADGNTLVITTDGGNADLPYLLSDYHLLIQPKGGVDKPDAAIGTGPYKLKSAQAGVLYVFEKNADDWDKDRGYYDGVEITVINDSTARNSALQSGQVHVINMVDPKVAKMMGSAPGMKVSAVAGRGHYVFIMHCDTAPFDNNDLRLALKYSINRQEMVDKILSGYGSIGNDTPINAAYPFFDKALEQRPFDLAKAAEHYKKSGHDGSPIELIVADTAFAGAVDAATLWQATCQQAGIPLTIKKVPDDGYWSDVWNVKPFCASYWEGRPVQDLMYATAYYSKADWNDTRFKNADFDKLLLEGRSELDPAKRAEIYAKMAKILWGEGGVIVPMFNDFIDAYSETIAGWREDPNFELMGGKVSHYTWLA
ncbi:MAG: ABC transporter substrate-binding protein [Paracoccaceae bacterium]